MDPTDPIRADALARRDAALAEAKRWDDFIRLYDELQQGKRPAHDARYSARRRDVARPHRTSQGAVGARVLETETHARRIIEEKGRPVPTKEMLSEMAAVGFSVGGQNPLSTLTTRLNRAPSLEHIRNLGWRIKVMPNQEEGAEGSPSPKEEPPTPDATTNDAARRGEVAHDNIA